MSGVKSKSYTLRTKDGQWLGQVVLTDDGMFASVTDYGNFSFSWRAFGDDFREFMSSINVEYFARKMVNGMAYVATSRKIEQACERFSEKILPPLQAILKEELSNNIEF